MGVFIYLVACLVLENILGKYFEICSIFSNLHHVIDRIPVFNIIYTYILMIEHLTGI